MNTEKGQLMKVVGDQILSSVKINEQGTVLVD